MEDKVILVDEFTILIHDNYGFMSLDNIVKIFSCTKDKIKNDLNDKEYISYHNEKYYSLNIIIMNAFDYDYKIAFRLYDIATKKKVILTDFVNKRLKEEKESFNKLNTIVKNNYDIIKSFYKYENAGKEINSFGNIGFITTESLQIMISLIKDVYDFCEGFGVIRDYSLLLDILYYINSINNDNDEEIEFDNDDDVCYIVKTMYNIIKKKPFVSGNEIIACFIAYYYLEEANLITDEGNKITSCSDIIFASRLIINANDNNLIEALSKAKSLLAGHYNNSNYNKELDPLIDTSKEGIINYIISSIEEFKGYQGYYDYYKGKSYVYKLHYHGSYNNFSLNKAKTFLASNTLYFNGDLYCYSEAPSDLNDRDKFLNDIVEEIKNRSYNDIIISFLNKLKNRIKPYFDLDSISIKFDFEIKTKFDEDYDL